MLQYKQQQNRYLETTVNTATPAQLLLMLMDGAIRFCRAGIEGIKQGNAEESNRNFLKVQNIINEFVITIDRKAPIAENLLSLYDYFNRRLIEANIKKDAVPAEEVLAHLTDLRATWAEAAKIAAAESTRVSHG